MLALTYQLKVSDRLPSRVDEKRACAEDTAAEDGSTET
jgi:hypothetical protein